MNLVILDTGCANIASVRFAFERLNAKPVVSRDLETIENAERLVFPGVGTANAAMAALQDANLVETVRAFPRPLIGICLGMQLLFNSSEEGNSQGIGHLDGRIQHLPDAGLPIPHMGWNRLSIQKNDPLLDGIEDGAQVYFLHSYAAPVGPATLASAEYGGAFSAIVRAGNIMGCQFHPERSGPVGARILRNFLELPA